MFRLGWSGGGRAWKSGEPVAKNDGGDIGSCFWVLEYLFVDERDMGGLVQYGADIPVLKATLKGRAPLNLDQLEGLPNKGCDLVGVLTILYTSPCCQL